jgi:calcineurin-like phosphoesterase
MLVSLSTAQFASVRRDVQVLPDGRVFQSDAGILDDYDIVTGMAKDTTILRPRSKMPEQFLDVPADDMLDAAKNGDAAARKEKSRQLIINSGNNQRRRIRRQESRQPCLKH